MSTDTRSSVNQHVVVYYPISRPVYCPTSLPNISVDMSDKTQSICRPRFVQCSVDISADTRSLCWPTLGRYLEFIITWSCLWHIGRLSVVYRSRVGSLLCVFNRLFSSNVARILIVPRSCTFAKPQQRNNFYPFLEIGTPTAIIQWNPRFNEPLFNEVLGQSYSKMYGKEPRYNKPSI